MNFFEHQDRAHRRTRVLLVLFSLAVLAIVVAMNAIALLFLGHDPSAQPGEPLQLDKLVRNNLDLLFWVTLFTIVLIGGASLYRASSLRGGGGQVARELGGTRVEPDTRDPLRRRLVNVVEEIAIASGVPVPEIYVLEEESGINAFAAGHAPGDAAIAVTRGTLETLNRNELQGVVAHEFGHILNGDMRLNIRLIGILYGILVLALVGQRVLIAMRFSRDSRNAAGLMAAGLALLVVGYIGLFFGRWIRASVSRQREYLADASAVQFTRQPDGIAGALKKIGARHARLDADSEEVGHMLFASGGLGRMFATHPPLEERIRAIEPGFDPSEFEQVARRMREEAESGQAAAEAAAEQEEKEDRRGPGGLPLDADRLVDGIADPGLAQILGAGLLMASMPGPLEQAAHSDGWAAEVVLYLLMNADPDVREQQRLMVAEKRGGDSERRVGQLLDMVPQLRDDLRIPLLEMAFPVLRRHPREEREQLQELVESLIHADGRVSAFEYALGRLLNRHLMDAGKPGDDGAGGHGRLDRHHEEARFLLAVLARHGHPGDPDAGRAALTAGIERIEGQAPAAVDFPEAWTESEGSRAWAGVLDQVLDTLDALRMADKERLVRAMLTTVTHGGQVRTAEVELLRAMAASMHVPLPLAEFDAGEEGMSSAD
ncbi:MULTISPECIES: M48 family metallopeptidase [Thioalkalivibrio]|uniref:Peptidase M48 n=1 Tax=Thioalkalivibrio halophilus TaxID=252474 RepID=A0A1V3A0N3_9GAMM|nr:MULTISPECIES: M48 family metallopeptidase [Thioalkalivibrio]OOC10910.1 peptidase M48 [Thioalkalivibrio halophilus]